MTMTSMSSNKSQQLQTSASTPDGSPPLNVDAMTIHDRSNPPSDPSDAKGENSKAPMPSAPGTTSFSRPIPLKRPPGVHRRVSQGGGIQTTLDDAGSWHALSHQNAPAPADILEGAGTKDAKVGSSGVLGFLSRKAGRERSPKPQEPGILGKEGARRIIS
jgi:serine/threonine kinase 32